MEMWEDLRKPGNSNKDLSSIFRIPLIFHPQLFIRILKYGDT
jgi:hypothetical protein